MLRALDDIAAERRRQIETEGWSAEHDDSHDSGQMARAAACYAAGDVLHLGKGKTLWPWGAEWWKPKDRRRDLVRAAALIVAEIERLDRTKVKMVEVWRVEYAQKHGDKWFAEMKSGYCDELAATMVADRLKEGPFACIRVTGPHQQEVPA